jgi:hypothetical protein
MSDQDKKFTDPLPVRELLAATFGQTFDDLASQRLFCCSARAL